MDSFTGVALSHPQPTQASILPHTVRMLIPQTFGPLMTYPNDVCTVFLLQLCITESVVILEFTEGKGVNGLVSKDSTPTLTHFESFGGSTDRRARKVGEEWRRLCRE